MCLHLKTIRYVLSFQMMLTFMHETCNKNIDLLDNFAENGQSFELREMFGKFTMDTIASCAFGLDPQASTHKGRFLYYVSTLRGFENVLLFFDFFFIRWQTEQISIKKSTSV